LQLFDPVCKATQIVDHLATSKMTYATIQIYMNQIYAKLLFITFFYIFCGLFKVI
jgi:hypothetical protein